MTESNSRHCGFLQDEYGTLTMEFLLWLPVLAFWLVVSVAFYDAYKSRADAAKAAHTLTDIVSRQVEVTENFFTEMHTLEEKLLPRIGSGETLRLTSIQYDANEESHSILWSEARGGGQPLRNEEIPLALMPAMAHLDTVILSEVSVPYQPFTTWSRTDITEWSFALVTRPRFVTAIAKID